MRRVVWDKRLFFVVLLGCGVFLLGPFLVRGAATPSDGAFEPDSRQRLIEAKSEEIRKLEAEAERYRTTLEGIGREADSLQNQVKTLDNSLKRLGTTIRTTNVKISRTTIEIEVLDDGIAGAERSIDRQRAEVAGLVAALAAGDRESPIAVLAKHDTLSEFFSLLDGLVRLQGELHKALGDLRKTRQDLTERKSSAEQKRIELRALAGDLADQKRLEEDERRQRSLLLAETKNQERRYQELLREVERKRDALQQEINSLEGALTANFDRSLLPAKGSGVLGWPLPEPIFITQYFGDTSFARAGGYNGKGHNGIDLRANQGTPVFASERGTVRATGDTDIACRRASYGRWVLVDHPNNLSTLYTHLSLIRVGSGEVVNRGEVIAYSGRTGYATGPHLHFSVFARQAVTVGELKSRTCGRIMTLPLSPFGGYLNPLDYL